jgi:hypothetical protein
VALGGGGAIEMVGLSDAAGAEGVGVFVFFFEYEGRGTSRIGDDLLLRPVKGIVERRELSPAWSGRRCHFPGGVIVGIGGSERDRVGRGCDIEVVGIVRESSDLVAGIFELRREAIGIVCSLGVDVGRARDPREFLRVRLPSSTAPCEMVS